MSKEEQVILPKKAIEAIYESLINNEDKIREVVKSLGKFSLAINKAVKNQAEIIPWMQDLEARLSLSLDVFNGSISKEEYDALVEQNNDENEEEDDSTFNYSG